LNLKLNLVVVAFALPACCSEGRFPNDVHDGIKVTKDEFVDAWKVNGEDVCAPTIEAVEGCYVLEAKYSADYLRQHGASRLWGISPLAAAIDTATRIENTHYESTFVPFALQLVSNRHYYVTATFNGDFFTPRILELNAENERTLEILPPTSADELARCRRGASGRPNPG
jgi:hypothetical protein